jgi:hypothetical protein
MTTSTSTDAGTPAYFPGCNAAARRAYDAWWSAHLAEDAASDLCPAIHCDESGVRTPAYRDRCDDQSPAGNVHRLTISAAIQARTAYENLRDLELSYLTHAVHARAAELPADPAATGEATAGAEDDLTAIMRATFEDAGGTVAGRTPAAQKAADAIAPRSGWRA